MSESERERLNTNNFIEDALRLTSPCTFGRFILYTFMGINGSLALIQLIIILVCIYTYVRPPIQLLSSVEDYSMVEIISDWSVLLVDSKLPLVIIVICIISLTVNIFGIVSGWKFYHEILYYLNNYVIICTLFAFMWLCLLIVYPIVPRFVDKTILDAHEDFVRNYYKLNDTEDYVTKLWDEFQAELRCCGVRNYSIFELLTHKESGSGQDLIVPFSCCLFNQDCVNKPNIDNSFIETPCERLILDISRGANMTAKLIIGATIIMYLFLTIHGLSILCDYELKKHYNNLREKEKEQKNHHNKHV